MHLDSRRGCSAQLVDCTNPRLFYSAFLRFTCWEVPHSLPALVSHRLLYIQGDSLGKGMKRPAAEPIEAAKAHSKKSRAQDSGTTGKKPVGKEERKTAPKETKLVDSPIRPRIAVAGQQVCAGQSRSPILQHFCI